VFSFLPLFSPSLRFRLLPLSALVLGIAVDNVPLISNVSRPLVDPTFSVSPSLKSSLILCYSWTTIHSHSTYLSYNAVSRMLLVTIGFSFFPPYEQFPSTVFSMHLVQGLVHLTVTLIPPSSPPYRDHGYSESI